MWPNSFFLKLGTSILQIMIWTTGVLIILLWQHIIVWSVHTCKCSFTWYCIYIFYLSVEHGLMIILSAVSIFLEQSCSILNGWSCMHLEAMKATHISCSWGQQVSIDVNKSFISNILDGSHSVISISYRVSSPKNENSVINYSPSCRSKSVRPSFIFRKQIKIFFYEIWELSDPA